MFCHSCGKETKEMGLCIDCYLKEHPIWLKDLTLQMCGCGRFNYGPLTLKYIDKYLPKIVKENLVASPEITITYVDVSSRDESKKVSLKIKLKGTYRGEEFEKEIGGVIKKIDKSCSVCGRISASYYEGVVQFRIPVNVKKVLDGDYVTRTEKVAGGFDAYVTSSNYAKKLGKQFSEKGYVVKQSAKLIGKKEGEDLYRVFVAILSPGPEAGDIIKYKDKMLCIQEFGKNIRTRDIVAGKTLMMPPKELQTAEIITKKDAVRTAMVSSVNPKGVQIMDTENYQTYEVPTQFDTLKEKEEIKYVQIKNKIYIL
jgi:nonsense-mediated mRNA decay protein 3